MRLTRWTLVAVGWLVCVGVVAGVAWYAIDSAGRQVRILGQAPVRWGSTSAVPDPQDEALAPTPAPASTTSTPAATPTVTPTLGAAVATGPTPAAPSPDRTTGGGGATAAPRSTPTPRPPKTPKPSGPGPTISSETTETRGGSVTVTCSSSAPIDYVVNPDQGWSASGKRSGPTEAEIKLSRPGSTIEVHAKCVDGRPRTTVEEHLGGGDD
jgi:hypothetical protein